MVTKTTDYASKLRKQHGEPVKDTGGTLAVKINQLRKQIRDERTVSIKVKLQRNGENLQCQLSALVPVISSRDSLQTKQNRTRQMLSTRINHPECKFRAFSLSQGFGEKDHINNQDGLPAPSVKFPGIKRLPPFTTWIHLTRNEKMGEDQSVTGKRRIYYEKHGGEALICSDSDEEVIETEQVKHEFSDGEDQLIWMAFEEHGLTEEVLNIVSQFVRGTSSEIRERYKNLKHENLGRPDQHSEELGGHKSHIGICLEKSLSAALDSFDNLFCRRCTSEKQPVWSEPEGDSKPCSDQCFLLLKDVKNLSEYSTPGSLQGKKSITTEVQDRILAPSSLGEPSNRSTEDILQEEICFTAEVDCCGDLNSNLPLSESMGKRKVTNQSNSALCDSTLPLDDSQNSCKKLKRISNDIVTVSSEYNKDLNLDACNEEKHTITSAPSKSSVEHTSHKVLVSGSICHGEHDKDVRDGKKDVTDETEVEKLSNSMEGQVDEMLSFSEWKPLEKELYLKGVEMFGRNSCLIARNLLSGLKTCTEVAGYMSTPHGAMDKNGKIIANCTTQSKSRVLRKRGKAKKIKYSFKSAGIPSSWKRISYGKNQGCKQYNPCECQGMCGKQCPCHDNGTCCEKYCGCSKLCKNRFRGCHCAKSQCRSRQCPCFAAGRECDPDVCRNCWVSCGDGSLGEPPRHGDGQCGNMRLLLRQRRRILLAKSKVAGWGAFIKNPVNKNDYLGEYTGELISQTEADRRGKIYDRINSSFLFDLNDKSCLDACRKGDKLKFANHSSHPNCYAKVVLVAGDHRVGIFAKENIEAGEELFYDYRYGPEVSLPWCHDDSKKYESAVSHSRARKHQ